ncbi:MAG TPA: primosomal protein N', partial [Planctomycetota bacterium]|nr:primosomal protein N' [Planctomycetota bacterium]
MGRFARVAPPLPVSGLFTYEVPPELARRVVPGVRVLVPFGSQRLAATTVGVDDQPPPPGVASKPLLRLLDDEPVAGPDILQLTAWVATATGCSWGEALDAALPPAVKSGRAGRSIEEIVLLQDPRLVRPQVDELQARREKQARALRILAERGGALPVRELMNLAHVSRSPLDSLVRGGLCTLRLARAEREPLLGRDVAPTQPLELTPEQQACKATLVSALERAFATGPGGAGAGRAFLLFGITGSGKTEVYLQTLAECVAAGRQGIVLVPEISLTPQTVRRFRERFERVAVLHSHLTDAERGGYWRRVASGHVQVVVGARSAVFAPTRKLGLIVIDEEHEHTFKQESTPRYHARDVAVMRARLEGIPILMGSATPSLESWSNAARGNYTLLSLPSRVEDRPLPKVKIVDLRHEPKPTGKHFAIGPTLEAAMNKTLKEKGQIILLLNRRGFSTHVHCQACGHVAQCANCDLALTFHRTKSSLMCHYCGFETAPFQKCPACSQPTMRYQGLGTEKLQAEIEEKFPGFVCQRMDSDTMTRPGSHERVLDAFRAGHVHILMGTQMIAKGL